MTFTWTLALIGGALISIGVWVEVGIGFASATAGAFCLMLCFAKLASDDLRSVSNNSSEFTWGNRSESAWNIKRWEDDPH